MQISVPLQSILMKHGGSNQVVDRCNIANISSSDRCHLFCSLELRLEIEMDLFSYFQTAPGLFGIISVNCFYVENEFNFSLNCSLA